MRKLLLALGFACIAAVARAQNAPPFIFPLGSADGTTTGQTTSSEASAYLVMTGYSSVAIQISYDTGVTGTVFLECIRDAGDVATPCNGANGTALPFPDHSALSDTFRMNFPAGRVRVRFASLAGTDATHKVYAKFQGTK